MKCETCAEEVDSPVERDALRFLPSAEIDFRDARYYPLLQRAVSRIPGWGLPVRSVSRVKLRKRGTLRGLAGLTTVSVEGHQLIRKGKFLGKGKHEITFYSSLLDKLSDDAVVAVMAHELAHAWLNEHVRPEASKQRERDADMLAEMWGFEPEVKVLEREADPL